MFLTTTEKIDRKRKWHLSKTKYYCWLFVSSRIFIMNKVRDQTDKNLSEGHVS